MQYMLLLYSDANSWLKMTPEEQKQGLAAYEAYMGALDESRGLQSLEPAAADLGRHDGSGHER